jgi:hypothetical protein
MPLANVRFFVNAGHSHPTMAELWPAPLERSLSHVHLGKEIRLRNGRGFVKASREFEENA